MQESNHTYQLLDCGHELKLEQVGPYRLIRSAPQAIWTPMLSKEEWNKADASLTLAPNDKVNWHLKNADMPEEWQITVPFGTMCMKRSDVGHIGIFAEQMPYWVQLTELSRACIEQHGECRVLNLFAYTGGSTLACAKGGASVVHVDASKPSVTWARKNADASGLSAAPIRWIVDDVVRFVEREVKRGNTYHGIIVDPPTYGKGGARTWKIEADLGPLLQNLQRILDPKVAFIHLSAHSPNYEPDVLEHELRKITPKNQGTVLTEEMIIPSVALGNELPSGASCLYTAN